MGSLFLNEQKATLPYACIYSSSKHHFATTAVGPVVDWRIFSGNCFWSMAFCQGMQGELPVSGRSRAEIRHPSYILTPRSSHTRDKNPNKNLRFGQEPALEVRVLKIKPPKQPLLLLGSSHFNDWHMSWRNKCHLTNGLSLVVAATINTYTPCTFNDMGKSHDVLEEKRKPQNRTCKCDGKHCLKKKGGGAICIEKVQEIFWKTNNLVILPKESL